MPSAQPLISIVIPCFNQGQFLGEALSSVQAQTYPHYEVIVVDDGSTAENDQALFSQWPFSFAKLVRQENLGLPAARNAGAAIANGDFFVFLDADDRLLPEFLHHTLALIGRDSQLGWVHTWWREFGMYQREYRPLPEQYDKLLIVQNIFPVTALVRRKAFAEVGGFFEIGRGYEDWDFWLNLAKHNWQVEICREVLFEYRKLGSSSMIVRSRQDDDNLYTRLLQRHEEYVAQHHKEALVIARRFWGLSGGSGSCQSFAREGRLERYWFAWQRRCLLLLRRVAVQGVALSKHFR